MDELKKYGKDIIINDYELNILLKCNIDVLKCNKMEEVLYLIDKYLDETELEDEDYEEIDYVASVLNERKYYMGNK